MSGVTTIELDRLGLDRPMPATDDDVPNARPCPDCGYNIEPGFQHSRQPQPDGASHVVCRLTRPLRWSHWSSDEVIERAFREPGESFDCSRCGLTVPPYWRHFVPTCRPCAIWSVVGQALMAVSGLNGHPWLYWGARPWCGDCHGTGRLPCQPQDLSIMRRSGSCATCGAWSFVLFHATKEQHGDVEGSARHYDDEADHEVVVGAAPLVGALTETLTRA